MGNLEAGFASGSRKCVVNSISLKGGEEEFIRRKSDKKDMELR